MSAGRVVLDLSQQEAAVLYVVASLGLHLVDSDEKLDHAATVGASKYVREWIDEDRQRFNALIEVGYKVIAMGEAVPLEDSCKWWIEHYDSR
jgi:hypothetical protein